MVFLLVDMETYVKYALANSEIHQLGWENNGFESIAIGCVLMIKPYLIYNLYLQNLLKGLILSVFGVCCLQK